MLVSKLPLINSGRSFAGIIIYCKDPKGFSGWVKRAVEGIPKEVAEGTTISMKKSRLINKWNE